MTEQRHDVAKSSSDALLARLIKLTSRKEDFITECFAAVLQADRRAAAEYWRMVGHGLPASSRTAKLREIDTQCRLGKGSSRCDLVLVGGRERIAVEHKLTAPQGKGQLLKYLQLPRKEISRVMLVSADYQTVPRDVLRERRYIRPSSGQNHFLWADFYPLLQRSAKRSFEVAEATVGLFDRLGLQPAHPLIGELRTRDPARRLLLDGKLYKAWEPLMRALSKHWNSVGSSFVKDRRSELYIEDGKGEVLRVIWIDPFSNPGGLRIRLKTDSGAKRDLIMDRLEFNRADVPHGRYITLAAGEKLAYRQRFPFIVEVRIPWRSLLGSATRASMPVRLRKFIIQLIQTADPTASD